ncbi:GTP cyclohydrolase, FolE2/MptA family, partial [Burkholderia pseudomallei]
MNLMNPEFAMPDVQSTVDTRQMPIQRVGVRAVRHPLTVRTAEGETQATVGTWNLDVHLPADQKGTHMSRFVALLEERGGPLTADAFRTMLATMLEKLEARAGRIEVSFPYFVNKTAPVSGVRSLLDYEVTLTGD